MPIEIDLVRHGETEGNAARIWQGHGDTPLTARGERQAQRLGTRLGGRSYAAMVVSDLGRAGATAAAVGGGFTVDPAWREADVGSWEGLAHAEVAAMHAAEIAALEAGEDVRFGGGEKYSELRARARRAFDALAAELRDGERGLVVTHGGIVGALAADVLGIDRNERRRALYGIANTSITTIRIDGGRRQLAVVNDAAHLDGDREPLPAPAVTLVRHGETAANAAGRWQGVTDGELTSTGRLQAEALAPHMGGHAAIYSSPLRRARDTAAAVARANGLELDEHPALRELRFGEWEDCAPTEIAREWPEQWRRIYVEGHDLPRGGTGETFAEAGARMEAAIADIAGRHPDDPVAIVSHGGAIRAFLTGFLGLPFAERRRIDQLRNTATCRVVLGDGGPRLVDYNVAPHLEAPPQEA